MLWAFYVRYSHIYIYVVRLTVPSAHLEAVLTVLFQIHIQLITSTGNTRHPLCFSLSSLACNAVSLQVFSRLALLTDAGCPHSSHTVLCYRSRRLHHVRRLFCNIYIITVLITFFCSSPYRFVGLGEDPQVLAIRAPALFGVSTSFE